MPKPWGVTKPASSPGARSPGEYIPRCSRTPKMPTSGSVPSVLSTVSRAGSAGTMDFFSTSAGVVRGSGTPSTGVAIEKDRPGTDHVSVAMPYRRTTSSGWYFFSSTLSFFFAAPMS